MTGSAGIKPAIARSETSRVIARRNYTATQTRARARKLEMAHHLKIQNQTTKSRWRRGEVWYDFSYTRIVLLTNILHYFLVKHGFSFIHNRSQTVLPTYDEVPSGAQHTLPVPLNNILLFCLKYNSFQLTDRLPNNVITFCYSELIFSR